MTNGVVRQGLPIKGMTYGWGAHRGVYRTPAALDSLRKLADTGTEWVALSFWTWQDSVHSTTIPFDYAYTVTDRDIAYAVDEAHRLGLKVALKPVVNSRDHIWRAHIGFPADPGAEPYWQAWFAAYRAFIVHYADLAQELAAELFCIGCEMVRTERRVRDWEAVIGAVRAVYAGPLVYNANHGQEDLIPWFSQLDLIGTSAYYPVADGGGASQAAMEARWHLVKPRLAALYERFHKPVVFMEVGCRSAFGCAATPWDFTHRDWPASEAEQANFYASAFQVFWREPWFAGFFWWDWSPVLYPASEAGRDTGFNIYGKAAEHVLRQWYQRDGRESGV